MARRESGENAQPIYTCGDREPDLSDTGMGAFLPVFEADLKIETPTHSFAGTCYGDISMTFSISSETTFDVDLTLSNKAGALCSDRLFFANTEIFHQENFRKAGTYKLTFDMPTVDDQEDVAFGGIKVFMFC